MRRTYRRPKPKPELNLFRINEQITVPQVRVIDDAGNNLGVMSVAEALVMAREQESDLIEVFPKAQPPVAKIADYGRLKYQKEKQMQKQQAKQKKIETKSVRLSLRIGAHDMELRLTQAQKFLEKGHKLKIELVLKGRERQLRDKAKEIIVDFIERLKQNEQISLAVEQDLTKQPNGFNMIVVNKK